jgi:phosphoribosylformimino-5-aminoimidazole carboxamide ribotide isomerase
MEMMTGPNLERAKSLVEAVNLPIIAAGGVNTIEDIKKLTEIGVDGAIIGRALYEGSINLVDALKAAGQV